MSINILKIATVKSFLRAEPLERYLYNTIKIPPRYN